MVGYCVNLRIRSSFRLGEENIDLVFALRFWNSECSLKKLKNRLQEVDGNLFSEQV